MSLLYKKVKFTNGYALGKACPICGCGSVFSRRVYKNLVFYTHTETKCLMPNCNYGK